MGNDIPQTKLKGKNNMNSDPNGGRLGGENSIFERDPRLVEQILFIPQLFSGIIDADIKRVQRLVQSMPTHTLESELIDSFNERFSRNKQAMTDLKINKIENYQKQLVNGVVKYIKSNYIQTQKPRKSTDKVHKQNTVNQPLDILLQGAATTANNSFQQSQNENQQKSPQTFYELQSLQRFVQLLKQFQHWFYIEQALKAGMRQNKNDKKMTIRKKIIPNYQSKLDKLLFSKLYLKYYLIIMKKNYGSKDKERRRLITDFHNSIGKMICLMIEHNHLSEKKLIQLAYKSIYLQKIDTKVKLKQILNEIKDQFWPFYLTKEHNLTLKTSEHERIKQISRCYLNQLYLRSLKQAEDPDIIVDPNEGFGVVKSFPICRARQDKNR